MKAAVLIDPHNMVVEEVPKPVAGNGEVVLRVGCCGICGTDLEMFRIGSYTPRAILGHECSGVIEEIGPGVAGWTVGDRVVVDDVFPCGRCEFCLGGRERLCRNVATLGGQWSGAFAEYTKVPAGALFRLPNSVSLEEGALVQVLAVGHHVVSRADVHPHAKTLVYGAGPIGLSVLAALRMAGFRNVAVVAKHDRGKQGAEALSASAILASSSQDIMSETESIFSSAPQLIIECVGKPATVLQSLQMVEKEGTVVVVGNCFEEISLQPITWILKEITIKGSDGATKDGFQSALGWLAARKVEPSVFITRTTTLDDLPETMAEISARKQDIKVVVKFSTP
jgi:(R,R)-butanediol dehydrogenase/meso-butanediol dehydrogenase/diacetyl reductase